MIPTASLLMRRDFCEGSFSLENLKKLSFASGSKKTLHFWRCDVGNEKENVFEKKYHRCETYYEYY
jgi:hypothetical protein